MDIADFQVASGRGVVEPCTAPPDVGTGRDMISVRDDFLPIAPGI